MNLTWRKHVWIQSSLLSCSCPRWLQHLDTVKSRSLHGHLVTLSHCDTVTLSEKQQLHCHPQNNYSRTGTPEGTGRSFSLDVVVIKVTMRSVNCNVTVTSCRAMVPNHRGAGPYWYQTTDKLNSSISDVTPTTN